MTQTDWILAELQLRPLTSLDALDGIGCFRLAARIADLRQAGHRIFTLSRHLPNGKLVAEYHLVGRQVA